MTLSLDPVLHLLLRAALAALFGSAAMHKLRDLDAFRDSLAAYELVPGSFVGPLSVLIVAAEVCVAAALLVAAPSPLPALSAVGLLFLYTGAIAINLLRGRRDIDCGCAGPARHQPLGAGLVARNLVLLAAALGAALPTHPRAFVWIDGFTLVSGLAAVCLLYVSVDALLAGGGATSPRPVDENFRFEVQNG